MNQNQPNSSDCPSPQMLADFVNGRLSYSDLNDVEIHIQNCDRCSAHLSAIPSDSLVKRIESAKLNEMPRASSSFVGQPFELGPDSRYQIIEELGSGGMGQVFKARHKIMKRTVAIKTIRPELLNNQEAIRRFAKEARAAARLSHPNIVSAFDAEQEGDLHFLVMEYVDGESLNRLVNRSGPLEARAAANFIGQAAEGLQHACERGMVHRDIKPHNLMLASDGTLKILDFGLSKFRREYTKFDVTDSLTDDFTLTMRNTSLGTEGYVSPEQARDASSADIRSDIFSLGCTLFFLLTNRAPFFGFPPDDPKLMPDIRRFRNDLPVGFAQVLERMMQHSPDDRFQRPEEIVAALKAIDYSTLDRNGPMGSKEIATTSAHPSPLLSTGVRDPNSLTAGIARNRHLVIGIPFALALVGFAVWMLFKIFAG